MGSRQRHRQLTKLSEHDKRSDDKSLTPILSKPPSGDRKVWGFYFAVPAVLATIVYLNSLRFGFFFDDRGQILLNRQIQSWSFLPRLLSTHVWSQQSADSLTPLYRPVFSVWLLIIYSIFGTNEAAWHAVSVGLYILVTVIVYLLAEELLHERFAAFTVALLFAVHPIHIESVCWISACNELLVGILFTSSLLLFLRGRRLNPSVYWTRWMLLSMLSFAASLFAKESVLLLAAVYPYLAWWSTSFRGNPQQRFQRVVITTAPYFAMVCVYCLVRVLAVGTLNFTTSPHTWIQVAYTGPSLLASYLWKLAVPINLSTFYSNPIVSTGRIGLWALGAMVIALFLGLVWLCTKSREIGIVVILTLAPIVPVILAVKIFHDGDMTHDRYLFVPSIGFCLLMGVAIKWLIKLSKFTKYVSIVWILGMATCFAWLTSSQEKYYRDQYAFFGRALQVYPNDVLVMDYLGDAYMRDGHMVEAIQQFEHAHLLAPDDPNTGYYLARGLYKYGDFSVAKPLLETVYKDPKLSPFRRFRGTLLLAQTELQLHNPDRARSVLSELAAREPTAPDVHFMLGSMYEVEGRRMDAEAAYEAEYQISANPLAAERALRLSGHSSGGALIGLSGDGNSQVRTPENNDPE